jgi:shikimate dehydrogenase
MFPKTGFSAVNLDDLPEIEAVFDAVYNPLSSKLILDAKNKGITCSGGLYMLVSQAAYAVEKFIGAPVDTDEVEKIFTDLYKSKMNIVLIGMPSSGKSTVASIIASQLNKQVKDTDKEIESKGKKITQIFADGGEKTFRDLESQAVVEVSKNFGVIIATGGGSILRKENVNALKQNGKLYFIDRPLECLVATDDRPLSKNAQSMKKLYNERYEIYNSICDCKIKANCTANEVAEKIIKDFTL